MTEEFKPKRMTKPDKMDMQMMYPHLLLLDEAYASLDALGFGIVMRLAFYQFIQGGTLKNDSTNLWKLSKAKRRSDFLRVMGEFPNWKLLQLCLSHAHLGLNADSSESEADQKSVSSQAHLSVISAGRCECRVGIPYVYKLVKEAEEVTRFNRENGKKGADTKKAQSPPEAPLKPPLGPPTAKKRIEADREVEEIVDGEDKDNPLMDQDPLGREKHPPHDGTDPQVPPVSISTPSTLIPSSTQEEIPTAVDGNDEYTWGTLPSSPNVDEFPDCTTAKRETYEKPVGIQELNAIKEFRRVNKIRLAALPPTAKVLEQAFNNPWTDSNWFGNQQNISIALMNQFNLLAKYPDRKEEGIGTGEYIRLMPEALEILDYVQDFDLKAQLALHYMSTQPVSAKFILFLGNYFNSNVASNYVEEHAYKLLKSRPYGRKDGIPVMLLVETSPEAWERKPALVWGWGKDTAIKPVYALLGADGQPIKQTPTHLHEFVWNYYDYAKVKEHFKALDKAKKGSRKPA